jgi:putative nucleotidyltransferase with HDIG domain
LKTSEIERLKEDLQATVKELSDSYEELSLLYKLSEELSGLSVDEICKTLLRELRSLFQVKTSAILFLDADRDVLKTKEFLGQWLKGIEFERENNIFWHVLETGKPLAVCDFQESRWKLQDIHNSAVIVAPLRGKKQDIGVLFLADKEDGLEFFSGDVKLLNTIAFLASLFIENALLTEEIQSFLIGTIRSFIKALEATSLWTAGHTERVTEYALGIASRMELGATVMEKLRICSLLHDIGKITIPRDILNKVDILDEQEREEIMRHPVVGAEILSELKGFVDIIEGIRYHHEHYDGSGLHGLKEKEIPLLSRIIAVADAFDAMTSNRPYRQRKSLFEAVEEIKSLAGKQFDPEVVKAFLNWINVSPTAVR